MSLGHIRSNVFYFNFLWIELYAVIITYMFMHVVCITNEIEYYKRLTFKGL